MFALDLFNTPYEKALKEGAVDKNECMGYGTLVGEDPETEYNARQMFDKHDRDVEDLGIIGQGEHWAGIQRAKQRRDEKDKEKKPGVAEESSQVGGYPQSPRAYGVGNFQRIVKANMGNLPTVTLEFADPNDNIVLDRKGVDLISDYYDGLENDSVKNHFIYRVLPSADEVLTILKRLGWHDAVQPELPGIPKQSELPLQEKKRLDKSPANASDTRVARELQKLRSQYPSAKNDLEVVAKAEIDSDDRSRQQLSAIKGANREQDRLLQQLIALDQKQGKEIDALDNENDRLEQHLANIEQTNDQLAQAIGQASGSATKKTAKDTTAKKKSQSAADRSTAPAPAEPAKATDTKQAEPKSAAIDRMAQDLTQPRKVQGIDQGPAPSIRGTVSDLDAYRRAQAAVTNKKFEPLARAMVDKGAVSRTGTDDRLNEFAPGGGGGSGDYLRALASAWYNGVFDTGSLPRGIKTQEDVERLLNRGIVCPDGKTRKLHIDYNSDFDGVEIYSDDYYEHGDESGELDSRTGQPWGPWDHMEFRDEELDEGVAEGWKDKVAGGALALGVLGGIGALQNVAPNVTVQGHQMQLANPGTQPDDAKLVTTDDGKKVYAWKTAGQKNRISWLYRPVEQVKEQGVAEGSKQDKDMTGQTCQKCKKDKYQERSQHDDMDGKVTCSCGNRVDRWKKYKEQGVVEGQGDFDTAINNLHGWHEVDSSSPDIKEYEFDDREGGYYAQGTVKYSMSTGRVKIKFEDRSGQYGDDVNQTFNSIGDAMNVLRTITTQYRYNNGKAQKFDRLSHREPVTPDKLRKTDRTGRKGTISGAHSNNLKYSIQNNKGKLGPKGVLPEGQGVAEGSNELYQTAIQKYARQVANDYLGGGNDYLYGANKFDSEMFGVDPKQAKQDFDRLFAQLTKPKGVAEGLNDTQKKIEDTINKLEDRLKHAKSDEQWDRISARIERLQAGLKRSKQGVAEGNYSDEANPIRDDGNELPDYAAMYENKLVEFAGGMGTGSVATAPGVGKGSNVGSLFGGSYSQKNSPFKKTKAKKESVIKR